MAKQSSLDDKSNTTPGGGSPAKKPFTFEDKHRFKTPGAADKFLTTVRKNGQDATQALAQRRDKIVRDSTAMAQYPKKLK